MDLIQVIEMLADWKAATLRHADGSLARSIDQNAERFGYGIEIHSLLWNTAQRLGWIEPDATPMLAGSPCCRALLTIESGDDGTSYAVCSRCGQPASTPTRRTLLDRLMRWLGLAREHAYRLWAWQTDEAILVSSRSDRAWRSPSCQSETAPKNGRRGGDQPRNRRRDQTRTRELPVAANDLHHPDDETVPFQKDFEQGRIEPRRDYGTENRGGDAHDS